MKRIIAALVLMSLLAMALAGCTGQPTTSAPPKDSTTPTSSTPGAEYPAADINMIIPFSAGGGTDTLMRRVGTALEQVIDHSVVVLNQPGNYGALGLTNLTKAEADGYTICGTSVYDVLGGTMLGGESVDVTWEDFAYVCGFNVDAEIFIASPQSGITTFEELVDYALANPGKLTVSTSGITHNILLGILNDVLGLEVTNVAYSGGGESLNALLGGHVDVALIGKSFAKQVDETYPVLCAMAPERLPSMPDVPAVSELYPEVTLPISTRIVVAPKDTPQEVLDQLEALLLEATDTEDFRTQLEEAGDYYQFTGSEDLREMVANTAEVLEAAIESNPAGFGLS